MSPIPESLEGFVEQISPDRFEIVAEETAASTLLLFTNVWTRRLSVGSMRRF
jgi:hypothetical protein